MIKKNRCLSCSKAVASLLYVQCCTMHCQLNTHTQSKNLTNTEWSKMTHRGELKTHQKHVGGGKTRPSQTLACLPAVTHLAISAQT